MGALLVYPIHFIPRNHQKCLALLWKLSSHQSLFHSNECLMIKLGKWLSCDVTGSKICSIYSSQNSKLLLGAWARLFTRKRFLTTATVPGYLARCWVKHRLPDPKTTLTRHKAIPPRTSVCAMAFFKVILGGVSIVGLTLRSRSSCVGAIGGNYELVTSTTISTKKLF